MMKSCETPLPGWEFLTPEELEAIRVSLPPASPDSPLAKMRANMARAKHPPKSFEPLDARQDRIDQMGETISTNLVGA